MSSPQEQFAELTRRTQENFKTMWQQWSERRPGTQSLSEGCTRSAAPAAA